MSRWVDLAAGANTSGGLTWLPEPIHLDGSTWPLKPIHLDGWTWLPEPIRLDGSTWLPEPMCRRRDLTAGVDTSGWLNLGTGTDVSGLQAASCKPVRLDGLATGADTSG